MTINKKKSTVYINLIIGLLLAALISYAIIEEGKFKLNYSVFVFLSIYYVVLGIYNSITPLIVIVENQITFYSFPNKKTTINSTDLNVKYQAGDYIFTTTNDNKFRIVKSEIPKNQLNDFVNIIDSLNNKSIESSNLVTV